MAFAAQRFLATPAWEDCIDEVLQRLGEAAGVSRVYLFENHRSGDGTLLTSQRYEWAAPGIAPQIDNPAMQGYTLEGAGWARWAEAFARGESIYGRTREFPERERVGLEEQDIVSIAEVPIFAGGEWWGFIGFDECVSEHDWFPSDIGALEAAAATLGVAIERRRAMDQLREAEAKYRALVEQIPAMTYIDEVGGPDEGIYVSPQIRDLLGFSPEEWYAEAEFWRNHLHPEDEPEVWADWRRAADDTGGVFAREYRMIARDGHTVWVSERTTILPDGSGRPRWIQGVLTDISQLKEAEEARRESEATLRATIESTADGILVVGARGEVVHFNEEFARMWRIPRSLLDTRDDDRLLAFVLDQLREPERFLSKVRELYGTDGEDFDTLLFKDGRVFERFSRPLNRGGEPAGRVWSFRDVTERRELLARLVHSQEDERRRIASDVQDDSLQKMVAVGLRLRTIDRERLSEDDRRLFEGLERTVELSIGNLRRLLFELHPPDLDRHGLAVALSGLLQGATEEAVRFDIEDRLTEELPVGTRAIAYRIAQEALANVRKHARASRVMVVLEPEGGGLLVRITDDGGGFEPATAERAPGHIGIRTMRERAELAGGWLRIDSSPRGTTVGFFLPAGSGVHTGSVGE